MLPPMRKAAIVAVLLVVALAGLATLVALEGREVVVLRTTGPDGELRRTRVWVADADGTAWIEAADPEREFYRDIERNPDVELERGGEIHLYRASILPNPEGHARIRALLREAYGWADRWVSLLVDTSRSIAIRLDPRSSAAGR